MNDELLTVKQIEERLKVSERTVFNLMKRKEIQGFKVGKSWRFASSNIDAYIERQKGKAQREEN